MAQKFYQDTISAEKGPYRFMHEPVIELTDSLEISESLVMEGAREDFDVEWVQESLSAAESLRHEISLEENLIGKEQWRSELYPIDSIRHYRDYAKFYNPKGLNPPYHYETWYIEQPLAGVCINRALTPYYVGVIENVVIHCKRKGTAGQTKVDIKLNGDSIFYNDADRPVLPYNSPKKYVFSETPYNDLISKNDVLTLDILEVATDVEGLTVNVAISQTSIPIAVQKVEAIDNNGFIYAGTTIFNRDTIHFKVYFTATVLFVPTIHLVDSEGNTTNLEIDTIASTDMQNDTIITSPIDASLFMGNYKLIVKDALSYTGIRQDPFEKTYFFTTDTIDLYLSYPRFTNDNEVEVTFNNLELFKDSISKYSYSLNTSDWTEDIPITNPFIIDITNSDVGGTTAEEDKTIYLQFKNEDGEGYVGTSIVIGYYYTPISFDAYCVALGSDRYLVDYSLPSTSTTVPPEKVEILNRDIVIYAEDFINTPLTDFDITVAWNGGTSQYDVSVDSGYTTDSEGITPISVSSATFNLDRPVNYEQHLYLVMIAFDSDTIICENVLAKRILLNTPETAPGETETGVDISYSDFAAYARDKSAEGYIVLYGVLISYNSDDYIVYNYIDSYTLTTIDITGEDYTNIKVKITDQAGRSDVETLGLRYNEVKMRVRVYRSGNQGDTGEWTLADEIENAQIFNTLPNNFYIQGEKI